MSVIVLLFLFLELILGIIACGVFKVNEKTS